MNEDHLLHQALEQPAGVRSAFLDQMCGGDEALRRRLESRLHEHGNPSLSQQATVAAVEAVAAAPIAEEPGSHVGPYKLLQQIGAGGMGVVFMAEQTEPVQRRVALKVVKPGMDSEQFIARFEAERQALALMDHPNIARVLDAGKTDSDRPYLVMELVKGAPITRFCDERRLTPRQRLELFLPVCLAVQHAHQKGIIHRDLKPSNVLVAEFDGKAAPKVIDFGVAKATGVRLTDKTLFTEFGAMVGTLEYMSPEQAELNQLDIDTRSDIYALGVLLYELLTGTTPLERKQVQRTSLLELLRIIREVEPPRPSTRLSTAEELPAVAANRGLEPKKLSGLLRGDLDWIVMKCLEKDRNRRYDTASALALDLERYLHDEPVLARPPSAAYRLRKFARRHRAGLLTAAVAGLFVLLAAAAAGWALWDRSEQQAARQTDRNQRQAELTRREAETERAVSLSLVKADQAVVQATRRPRATSGELEAALAVWREAETALSEAEVALNTGADSPPLRQKVLDARERIEQGRRQDEQRRAQSLRKENLLRDLDAARMARATFQDGHYDFAGAASRYAAAFVAYELDVNAATDEVAKRIRAEEPAVREALIAGLEDWANVALNTKAEAKSKELWEIVRAADDDAWRQQFRAATLVRDRAAVRSLADEVRRLSLTPATIQMVVWGLHALGDREQTLALLRWARGRHPTDFWIHFDLGGILHQGRGRSPADLEEEIGCYRAALALRPEAAAAHNSLGNALYDKNEVNEALACYRKALDLDDRYAQAHNNLGIALYAQEKPEEAIAAFRKAIEIDPKYAGARTNLSNALQGRNQRDEALAQARKAVELEPKFTAAHSNLAAALYEVRERPGALAEALAECEKALEIDSQFVHAYVIKGIVLRAMNRPDDAIAAYLKALELNPRLPEAHYNLGNVYVEMNRPDYAIAAYRKTIEYNPRHAYAYTALGSLLSAKNLPDEALAAYRKSVEVAPRYALGYYNLGNAFAARREWDEALVAYRKSIELDDKYPQAHNNLGRVLANKGDLDAAIVSYRKALDLDATLPQTPFNLGDAYLKKGEFTEAKKWTQKALDRLPAKHGLRPAATRQLADCDRLLALEARLTDVLADKAQPRDNRERLGLIEVCQYQHRHAAAERFYRDAFDADAKLADDQDAEHRYNAACSAVLAAAGQARDADKIDAAERTRLRGQALTWLRAEYEAWGKRLENGKPEDGKLVGDTMQHWQDDADLASVHDAKALTKLPADEQEAWGKLWADVTALQKKARDVK